MKPFLALLVSLITAAILAGWTWDDRIAQVFG